MTTMMWPIEDLPEIFDDITPIPQDDGPEPVCVIQYPTSFVMAYDRIRAMWKLGEHSERSLKLSATCLKLNPANYTVWHYRRECLTRLNNDNDNNKKLTKETIPAELNLTSQLGGSNPKNYQIWYHRRAILEAYHHATGNLQEDFFESELTYIAGVLAQDAKNYHAWSHRQWLVRTVNLPRIWEGEVEYARELIQVDPRNNSAWNQRWFAVHRGQIGQPLSIDACRAEADFSIDEGAKVDPYNESPFRYLIGLLREQSQQQQQQQLYAAYYPKVDALRGVLEEAGHLPPDTCANWTSCRVDLLEGMGDAASLKQAMELTEALANEYDPIRTKYWKLRQNQLQDQITA